MSNLQTTRNGKFDVLYHRFYRFVNYLIPLWMPWCCTRTMDTWWQNPNSSQHKFISQFQIDLPLKHLKILVFCRNNGRLKQKSWTKGQFNLEWIYEVITSLKMANQKLPGFLPYSLIYFQDRNSGNFWLAFWHKQWPHKFILNLTDL